MKLCGRRLHEMTPDNIYRKTDGCQRCVACQQLRKPLPGNLSPDLSSASPITHPVHIPYGTFTTFNGARMRTRQMFADPETPPQSSGLRIWGAWSPTDVRR